MPDFFLDTIPDYSRGTSEKNSAELAKKVNDLIGIIQKNLSSDLVQGTQAVYQFHTSGEFMFKKSKTVLIYIMRIIFQLLFQTDRIHGTLT